MEHVHYLILDEIIVMGKENNCRYKTIQEVSTLDEVWKKEVKIIDSYGDHELSGYYPKTGMFMTKMMMNLPSPVIKLLSIIGGSLNDSSVWDHFKYKSWGDDPQEIRVFRAVYELEGGELPALGHRTENRYAW